MLNGDMGRQVDSYARMVFVICTLVVFMMGCENSIPAADYDPEYEYPDPDHPQPAKEPIEVMVQLAGSEGGAYVVRAETEYEESDFLEGWGTFFNLGPTDYEGVLSSEPTEYEFSLGDGVYTDARDEVKWDYIFVNIDKDGKWEGVMYAKMFVNGELVDCHKTESNWSIRLSWKPPDGEAGWLDRFNCWMYPGF